MFQGIKQLMGLRVRCSIEAYAQAAAASTANRRECMEEPVCHGRVPSVVPGQHPTLCALLATMLHRCIRHLPVGGWPVELLCVVLLWRPAVWVGQAASKQRYVRANQGELSKPTAVSTVLIGHGCCNLPSQIGCILHAVVQYTA